MFIQTEQTPNPETLKFLPGRAVMETGTAYFPSVEAGEGSPLAQRLFAQDGVAAVFLGADFITVTKGPADDWTVMKPLILGAIMEQYLSGEPMIRPTAPAAPIADQEDDEIVSQICELLDTRVRPAVATDGGDIVFHGFENGIVYLYMQGACAGCPSSTVTLKMGIENMLRHYIPEVREVRSIEPAYY